MNVHSITFIIVCVIDNQIYHNGHVDNTNGGLHVQNSDRNIISGNNISDSNRYGIYMYYFCRYNVFTHNIMNSSGIAGLYISTAGTQCEDNDFYDNYFINNPTQVSDESTATPYNRYYNSRIGNYWDDHKTGDSDGDGIDDSYYTIDSSPLKQDQKPIYGNPFHNGSTIEIDGTAVSGQTSWQWISTRYWCNGTGTETEPYIIEGLDIDAQGSDSCIYVHDSTVFFTIQDCHTFNADDEYQEAGIKLENTDFGTIFNNNCSANGIIGGEGGGYGIHLYNSENNIKKPF